ncbi:UDP-galactopyranose mutase [Escherichia coli]|uniref:Glf n=8 Tax=Enterobacteriaceae TaxID=543 RepID=B5L448_SHIBO|nr:MULTISPECIES: UDP-galactopyranose mutase [Enterobacteriaceae]EFY4735450.1 UDP-galactopyranose mutase [Shigella dysenteriae]HCM8412040.1 UDP-galactopyranose mutase [Shigella flexneri]ACD37132.1 Glf [Shigella boydii]EAA3124836.1 UDP-galactopyranose mutase [Shigella boydii]EFB1755330.1 UDP-galactopyranose mutase [Escherichia coli]
MQYDFIIIGSGLFGAVCAYELNKRNKRVLVIEKRDHIGGNIYTEKVDDIHIHKYGAHIFHTNDQYIWNYINKFASFNRFTNSPLAYHKGKLYNLPFNMNTFYQLWGTKTPSEAQDKIDLQRSKYSNITPTNLEEQALSLVGEDVYEKLIKGYTEKQWGRSCSELPPFIIKRIPVRFTFDNNYFTDRFQGVPIGGYTQIIDKMLNGVDLLLNVDYLSEKDKYNSMAERIIYTGPIDAYFDKKLGTLEYRSLKFITKKIEEANYQGNAVINYTEKDIPFTRIIEHKHFDDSYETEYTFITEEYPIEWSEGQEPYYPINDKKNMDIYHKYRELSQMESKVIFGGRLAEYKYYDMHQVIRSALNCVNKILHD